jgi:hypothetical protein
MREEAAANSLEARGGNASGGWVTGAAGADGGDGSRGAGQARRGSRAPAGAQTRSSGQPTEAMLVLQALHEALGGVQRAQLQSQHAAAAVTWGRVFWGGGG